MDDEWEVGIEVQFLDDFPEEGHSYKGEIKDGLRHGRGKHTYANGDVFLGLFEDGGAVKGSFFFLSKNPTRIQYYGDIYEGDFDNRTFNGKGTHHYKSAYHKHPGSRYEGEYKDGSRNGEGIYYYADGSTQEGVFKDNWLTGEGRLTFSSGDSYEGFLFEGIPRGKGVYSWNNGDKYIGNYDNFGERTGPGEYIYKNDSFVQGDFAKGQIEGEYIGQFEESWHHRSQEHTIDENMKLRMKVKEMELETLQYQATISQLREQMNVGTGRKLQNLLEHNEDINLEFKLSMWTRYKTHNKVATREVVINPKKPKDPILEDEVLHTVAALLNTGGGTLLIGVKDKPASCGKKPAEVFGIENDYMIMGGKKGADDYVRCVFQVLNNGFGDTAICASYVKVKIEQYDGKDICRIDVDPLPRVKDGELYIKERSDVKKEERFYVRIGSSSMKQSLPSALRYIRVNFPPPNAPENGV